MDNETTLNKCPACGISVEETLTKRKWVHHDPYEKHGWAYEDGEAVTGEYCSECIRDIDTLLDDYHTWQSETNHEMDEEDWKQLAVKMVIAYKRVVTNWKDPLTKKELHALQDSFSEIL